MERSKNLEHGMFESIGNLRTTLFNLLALLTVLSVLCSDCADYSKTTFLLCTVPNSGCISGNAFICMLTENPTTTKKNDLNNEKNMLPYLCSKKSGGGQFPGALCSAMLSRLTKPSFVLASWL